MQSTEAEGKACALWEGKGCRALPHLPSELLQRKEGSLDGEPVQEALRQELCAISWEAGGGVRLSAGTGGQAPNR